MDPKINWPQPQFITWIFPELWSEYVRNNLNPDLWNIMESILCAEFRTSTRMTAYTAFIILFIPEILYQPLCSGPSSLDAVHWMWHVCIAVPLCALLFKKIISLLQLRVLEPHLPMCRISCTISANAAIAFNIVTISLVGTILGARMMRLKENLLDSQVHTLLKDVNVAQHWFAYSLPFTILLNTLPIFYHMWLKVRFCAQQLQLPTRRLNVFYLLSVVLAVVLSAQFFYADCFWLALPLNC